MLEVDALGQPLEVDHLEDWLVLDLLEEDSHAEKVSARKRLRLSLRFVELTRVQTHHQCVPDCLTDRHGSCDQTPAGWEDHDSVEFTLDAHTDSLGGEGSPLVSVTAPVQWAEAASRPLAWGKHYLADAMHLRYRYPRLHTSATWTTSSPTKTRTTRTDQPEQPRPVVRTTPPDQDPLHLDLPPQPRRHLHLDQPHRTNLASPPHGTVSTN